MADGSESSTGDAGDKEDPEEVAFDASSLPEDLLDTPLPPPPGTGDPNDPDADAAMEAALLAGAPDSPGDVLATVTAERDEYLDALQRLKAEFANHRRRTAEQSSQQREQAASGLVEKLLPVLDSCDAAMNHESDAVRPIAESLIEILRGGGLDRLEPVGEAFDPAFHEAVLHEAGDGVDGQQVVTEVLRPGYTWNGRVLRAAMVKVQG